MISTWNTLTLDQHILWDIAGIDGLQIAQFLFGDRVSYLAPFQSLETTFENCPCSILRLCEGNFRIAERAEQAPYSPLAQALQQTQADYRVWIRRFDWLSSIAIPETMGIALLPQIATTKPPYRLQGMAVDRAVPARIEEISVLIWRHPVSGLPAFELHTATNKAEAIKHILEIKAKLA